MASVLLMSPEQKALDNALNALLEAAAMAHMANMVLNIKESKLYIAARVLDETNQTTSPRTAKALRMHKLHSKAYWRARSIAANHYPLRLTPAQWAYCRVPRI